MKRFGVPSLLLLLTACLYSLSAGGGLPKGIKTVAVIPFENQTASPNLPTELHSELRGAILSRFGVRDAPEGKANAIVRGTIVKYEPDIAVGFSADPRRATTARRRVQIAIDVQIVDQSSGRTIFERKGLSAEGEYDERAEETGRKQAIQRLVNEILEGAQSQW